MVKRSQGVGCGADSPFHLRAPQDVLLLVHVHGEVLVLALLDGVGPGGDGPHFAKLPKTKIAGH